MSSNTHEKQFPSRRTVLKTLGLAPLLFRPSPFYGSNFLFGGPSPDRTHDHELLFADIRLRPNYPSRSPLEDILRLVPPGSDEYATERYAFEIELLLAAWANDLKMSLGNHAILTGMLDPSIEAPTFVTTQEKVLRSSHPVTTSRRTFDPRTVTGHAACLVGLETWL